MGFNLDNITPKLNDNLINNKNNTIKEGFTEKISSSKYDNDNIFKIIDNKLKGLVQELGGDKGKAETKKILTSTKKICNLECAKCMMSMIDNNKSIKSIDMDRLLDNDDDEDCVKCKKYTELSTSIQSIIDNL